MKVTIKKEVFKKFHPKLKIAFLKVEGLDNKTRLKESQHLLKEAENMIRLTFNKETVKNHDLIAPWYVAQEHFGKDVKHYNTAVERLMKKVLRGKSIATKDVLTNLLRYLALKYIIPFGVDDPTEIKSDLFFTVAQNKERVGILKRLKPGMLYYYDNQGVLGTNLDFWKNRRTKLVPQSFYALIHFEILPPLDQKKVNELIKETRSLIRTFCGGKASVTVLDSKKNSAVM
jgi:DNA/RNA-binding domain of Phe-tRNA-synthetase-like protein